MTNFNTLNPTDIYDFPKHWKKNKFYNLFSVVKDISKNVDNEAVLSLTQKGIVIKDIESNKGQIASNYEKYTKVKLNDIVFNPMDLISGWVDIVKESGVISPSYLSFRPNENKVNPFFALFLFQTLYVNKMLFNFGKGVATHDGFGRWSINEDIIKKTNIFLPDINTQNKIVNYLEQKNRIIDTLTEKLQKKIELLKEQRNSLIDHYVTKGLDPNIEMKDSGLEWIGEIPKHWKIVKSSHIIDIRDGTHDTPSYVEHGFPLVTQKDIYGGILTFEKTKMISEKDHMEISKRSRVVRNDIIMSMIGSVGYPTLVDTDTEFSIKNVCLFKTSTSGQNPKFIKYALESTFVVNQLELGKGGGVQNFVSLDVLRNIKIILPTKTEQNRIVESLEYKEHQINNLIHSEYRHISLLEEYRQSLISSVVTGKVQITEGMI